MCFKHNFYILWYNSSQGLCFSLLKNSQEKKKKEKPWVNVFMSIFGELENLKLEYYDIHRAREK